MNDRNTISTIPEFQNVIIKNKACLLYFSSNTCSVGEALDSKIQHLIKSEFPKMLFYYVDIHVAPDLAALNSAFVEPTILIFFDGKESIRRSRNIGVFELQHAIERLYKLIFNNSL